MGRLSYTAVRYDSNNDKIAFVKRHEDKGDTVGEPETISRQNVITGIENNKSYCTIYKGDDGKFKKGAEVGFVDINGDKYIRTDKNKIKKDNSCNYQCSKYKNRPKVAHINKTPYRPS